MKKNYFLLAVLLFALAFNSTKSQDVEMIVGGNMESADAWTITNLNAEVTASYEFNYNADFPSQGEGGCLHVTASTDGPMVNLMVFQQVTLKRGADYTCDLAFKNTIDFMNFWFEVWVGGNEPVDGGDYNVDFGGVLLGGFKYTGWEAGCSDFVDGLLSTDNCLPVPNSDPAVLTDRIINYEGEGDTTVYIGMKLGMGWEVIESDLLIDEFTLMGPATSSEEVFVNKTVNLVYPNPVNDVLEVAFDNEYTEISIYNMIGQELISSSLEKTIDVSELTSGMYMVEITDANTEFSCRN